MTLNLNDGSYRPYRKPNEETNYIHVNPDPSPPTIKEIPGLLETYTSIPLPSFLKATTIFISILELSPQCPYQFQKPCSRPKRLLVLSECRNICAESKNHMVR